MTIEKAIAENLRGQVVDDVISVIGQASWFNVYPVIDGECRLTGEVVEATDHSRDWRLRIGLGGWTQLIEKRVAVAAGWTVGQVVAKEPSCHTE